MSLVVGPAELRPVFSDDRGCAEAQEQREKRN